MSHPAVTTLEAALAEVQIDIQAADGAISDFRRQINTRKGRLAKLYKDRDGLADALAMVRKRVGNGE